MSESHDHHHSPNIAKPTFKAFLSKFPEINAPAVLGEETHMEFSRRNPPLPDAMIQTFILPLEGIGDEFTEYIACFQIKGIKGFKAIVYWKAELMEYRYTLATFTEKGEFIDKYVIAGTFSTQNNLIQSVCTIDEEYGITIMSGQSNAESGEFDSSASKAIEVEILPDGSIG